jgi:hypothetical protein
MTMSAALPDGASKSCVPSPLEAALRRPRPSAFTKSVDRRTPR